MAKADSVLVSGCSAGGLATYLHCDWWAQHAPEGVTKCLPDAGYFLDANDASGKPTWPTQMKYVAHMQNIYEGVHPDCVPECPGDEWKCLFAQYPIPFIVTPIFMLNSPIDTWQLGNILRLPDGC